MQTEMEKMRSGRQYCFADPEVAQSISRAQRLCAKLQTMTIADADSVAVGNPCRVIRRGVKME